MSVMYMFGVFARDGIKRVGPLSSQYMILRFRENIPQCLKSFLGNFNIVVSKNSLRILCQGSNGLTLFIPSLAKTANSYKTDKSKVNLEHQKAVFLFVRRCLLNEPNNNNSEMITTNRW